MKTRLIKTVKSLVPATGTLALLVTLSACSAEYGSRDQVATAEANELLTVVEEDQAAGKLILEYERNGRALTYDLRLGPEMQTPPSAEELALDPELPTREVDARVLDASGAVIYLQMGGDGFIDPNWSLPQVDGIDEAARRADIALMKAATSSFQNLRVSPQSQALRQTGIQISKGVGADSDLTDPSSLLSTQDVLAVGGTSVKAWDFQVRKHDLVKFHVKYGEHSAVLLRGKGTKGAVVFSAVSCNHGACANASSMSTHCTSSLFHDDGTHTRFFYSAGCTTSYSAFSTGGGHNCNDDSELQGKAITHDQTQSTTDGSCSSKALHDNAPDCTY